MLIVGPGVCVEVIVVDKPSGKHQLIVGGQFILYYVIVLLYCSFVLSYYCNMIVKSRLLLCSICSGGTWLHTWSRVVVGDYVVEAVFHLCEDLERTFMARKLFVNFWCNWLYECLTEEFLLILNEAQILEASSVNHIGTHPRRRMNVALEGLKDINILFQIFVLTSSSLSMQWSKLLFSL